MRSPTESDPVDYLHVSIKFCRHIGTICTNKLTKASQFYLSRCTAPRPLSVGSDRSCPVAEGALLLPLLLPLLPETEATGQVAHETAGTLTHAPSVLYASLGS